MSALGLFCRQSLVSKNTYAICMAIFRDFYGLLPLIAGRTYARMRFIPTHCEVCSLAALVPASSINHGVARCSACGAPARPLPGESYAAEDATLFNELAAALREAALTPLSAAQLSIELEGRDLIAPGRGLRRLAQVLPSLEVLELVVPDRPGPLRKAEGMLAALLDVIARGRAQSGMVPAFPQPRSKTGDGTG
jgi:hypothetical protein